MHSNKACEFSFTVSPFLFYCTSVYNKNRSPSNIEGITTRLFIFKSQLIQKQKMFFLFFPKGCRINPTYTNRVLKHLHLTHMDYYTLSPRLRMERHSVLGHWSTAVCPKSQAGLVEKCWNIWEIRWEDQSSNLRCRQFVNSKDSGKQFVSGPIHYGGNFLHWFPVWQLVRMLLVENPRNT